ncbi:MAG TPA: diphosphate--fructose-6-phosphate 1-phosphotransferase [Bryobacteraceae bacterium]|nr:diphosphate--fructose-6-phosphate 1-phosphotransferase [Bryobacteraceae bacterium]
MNVRGNALVLHGGGPTTVLNSSLAGIVGECRAARIGKLLGALGGAGGILKEEFADLLAESESFWDRAATSPGSVLGSSRAKITEPDFETMLAVLRRKDIRYVFLNGGNGTMELALRLSEAIRASSFEACVIGVPKTIDNDLAGTDHSPGYASAARFFGYAVRDIGADNRALPGITVVEILGRNAGWLAAATIQARCHPDDAPHLIYMPERRLPFEQLAADVEECHGRFGRAVIAVCEGQLDENGEPFGADTRASSRAPLALNLAHVLAQRLSKTLKISARSEKPGLLGRSSSALAATVDRAEARECGCAAVRAALDGVTGKMIALERQPGPDYVCTTGLVPLAKVAGHERLFPPEWLPAQPSSDMPAFRAWLAPLTGEIPPLPLLTYTERLNVR